MSKAYHFQTYIYKLPRLFPLWCYILFRLADIYPFEIVSNAGLYPSRTFLCLVFILLRLISSSDFPLHSIQTALPFKNLQQHKTLLTFRSYIMIGKYYTAGKLVYFVQRSYGDSMCMCVYKVYTIGSRTMNAA